MRKIKNPKFGEYVLVSRWGDHDPYDPWQIGTLEGITKNKYGTFYKVHQNDRWFPNCFRITAEEGQEYIRLFGDPKKTKIIEVTQ